MEAQEWTEVKREEEDGIRATCLSGGRDYQATGAHGKQSMGPVNLFEENLGVH